MKRVIREGTFESNSSSCHAICISKQSILEDKMPDYVKFYHGEFGWENDIHYDTPAYLHEIIHECYWDNREKAKEVEDEITRMLNSYGITVEWSHDSFNGDWYSSGYIDHGSECKALLNELLEDNDKLLRFLFGDSFVVTGNDNGDGYKYSMYENPEDENYVYKLKEKFKDYEIYEKWN